MSAEWIPGAAVGILGSLGAWLLSWRINSAKGEALADGMRQDIQEFKDDFKAGMGEIRALADMTARLQSSQNVVNSVQANALESILGKLDRHEAVIADHSSTLRLVTELVMTKREK